MKGRQIWKCTDRRLNKITLGMAAISCFMLYCFSDNVATLWNNGYINTPDMYDGYVDCGAMATLFEIFKEISCVWHLLFLVAIGLIVLCLFWDIRQDDTREWMFSLPVTERVLFARAWLRGMLAYTIPWLLYTVGVLILRVRNLSWVQELYLLDVNWKKWMELEQVGNYMKILVLLWIWGTACYSIFFFMQIACRKNVLAALFGTGIICTPAYLGAEIAEGILPLYSSMKIAKILGRVVGSWKDLFLFVLDDMYDATEVDSMFYSISCKISWEKMAFAVLVIVVCLILSRYYFCKINDQHVEGIFRIGWMRILVLTGLGGCIGVGIFANLVLYHDLENGWLVLLGTTGFTLLFAVAAHNLMKRRGY